MTNDKTAIEAVTTDNDGETSLRLAGGTVVRLTGRDVQLLELCFHTHCPDCKHP